VRISSLVPVQTSGTQTPLFMAHSYLLYHGLSKALGNDQPFYGLRELEKDTDLSIDERAKQYVADMRRVQPHGPYCVSGWCAAGPLAVEIARQLLIQGQKVGVLLLFDAWLPGYAEALQKAERSKSYVRAIQNKINLYLQKSKNLSLKEKAGYVGHVVRRIAKQKRDDFYVRNWGVVSRISKQFNVPLPQFMHNTSLQTFAALREFRADSMPLKITLVRATESMQVPGSTETCGWENVAENGVETLWAPGDHETMFRGNYLRITAGIVRKALRASDQGHVAIEP
jgi:thioesterase domain-containing protein